VLLGTGNSVLDALPRAEYRRLLPHLELVALPFGKVVAEVGERVTHAYFPTTAILSLVTMLEGHPAGEVAVVGHNGMLGISLLLEGEGAMQPLRSAFVQRPGHAYRLPAVVLVKELSGSEEFRQLLLRYLQALVTHFGQIAVCNRHHRIAERLSRWLLTRLDLSPPGSEIEITHEQLAKLLGVRREGVTAAAHSLQRAGAIRVQRACITVLDRSKLEQRVCECYAVIRTEYARLIAAGHHRDDPTDRSAASALGHADHGELE
jgi:CRP-like cAMP-binding protein